MPLRGEIYFVSLEPVKGREQGGKRPVLVVSADEINRQPLVVTVVCGRSGRNISREYSTNVRARADETGLREETVFLCFQLRSLDPSRFPSSPSGTMPPGRMCEIDLALKRALALR